MKALTLIALAACGPSSFALKPQNFRVADAKTAAVVAQLAADINADSLCEWVSVSPQGSRPLVIDTKWVQDLSFPARGACVFGLVDGDRLVMVDIESEGLERWSTGFYHQLGHLLGLTHKSTGIMRFDGGGLRGAEARSALLEEALQGGVPPCASVGP